MFFFIFPTFLFKIIVDTQEASETLCTLHQFPPVVISHITIAKYQNQEPGIGTMHMNHSKSFYQMCKLLLPALQSNCRIISSAQRFLSWYPSVISILLPHYPWTLTLNNLFFSSIILSFGTCYMNEFIQCFFLLIFTFLLER